MAIRMCLVLILEGRGKNVPRSETSRVVGWLEPNPRRGFDRASQAKTTLCKWRNLAIDVIIIIR